MNTHRQRIAWTCWIVVAAFATVAWAQATTKPAADEATAATKPAAEKPTGEKPADTQAGDSKTGHVRGNDVYVRSGYDATYYPVTKLNRGDEVTIVGTKDVFGWLEILPPAGTYSLVEKTRVDRPNADDQTGVLNDTAQVYAGSNLNDRKYAKQVKLNKGDKVKIIGESTEGGFYKIEPPPGATLWIKGDFVDRTGRLTSEDAAKTTKIETVKPGELAGAQKDAAGTSLPENVPPKLEKVDRVKPATATKEPEVGLGKYELERNAIEAEIAAEMVKPVVQRNYEPIIKKLQPLADQSEDVTAQMYGKARIQQVQKMIDLVAASRDLDSYKQQALAEASRIAKEREGITAKTATPPDEIVVRGEIRVSGLYDGSADRPKRWRVVDPKTERTLAYIELPSGSPIDPVQYYGKYVGIRASERRFLKNALPPVPIFVVKEITVQDPNSPAVSSTVSPIRPSTATPVAPSTVTPVAPSKVSPALPSTVKVISATSQPARAMSRPAGGASAKPVQ